ncbi:hypothetical protein BTVI_00393 [Pitangus sulphuratus]|nr:hypothetical protein BTVI_00393 [Pitangus sulphuratus]
MHGYPLHVDLQCSPQEFVLCAVDLGGLTACESFTAELLEALCHVYTVRAENSYCSFLRERSRLGLFLEKLSLYPRDVVVTALRPGSALISCYNSSLRARADGSWCAREEIQGALEKLGVPGGSISPHFVQAMLPEYEIDVIFSVSYSGLCSATTRPFHGPTLQGRNDSTVRETPPALLSSLCATAGVLLVILVCWLCKCPRRTPGSQSVLFQRSSRSGRADVGLDVLKARKAPVHECRPSAPPPLGIPPGAPLTSPKQCPRAIPLPHITPPFQPPKYQLPPHYGEGVTTHHGNSQRLK